jgi:hypothetical protein
MYLRVDERTDVLLSLQQCDLSVRLARRSQGNWKWAILALHNALQGALVCHLSGSAQLGALTERSISDWLSWYGGDRTLKPPREWLADTKELFSRLSAADKRYEAAGPIIRVTDAQAAAFDRLHALRNDFQHFTPKGWSLEIAGLPEIFLNVLDVISAIADALYAFRHMEAEERGELTRRIHRICARLHARAEPKQDF